MSTEIKKEIQLEIAHVLFMDIVGYSTHPINEQRALRDGLNQIVRRQSHKPKAICREPRRFSLRYIRMRTTPTRWKHKFTKRSWSVALHQSSLG
jgi:hypothetical protein